MEEEEGMEYSHCCQAGWGGVECVGVHYIVRAMYRFAGTPLVPGHRNQSRENSTLQESMHTVQGGGKIWWLRLKTRPVPVLFL